MKMIVTLRALIVTMKFLSKGFLREILMEELRGIF